MHKKTPIGIHFLETCKVLFESADTDGSGGLDSEEFVTILQSKALGLQLSQREVRKVKDLADKDDDGVITFDEFVPVVEQLLNRSRKKKKPVRQMWALAGTAARVSNVRRGVRGVKGSGANACNEGGDDATCAASGSGGGGAGMHSIATSALDVLKLRREGLRALTNGDLPKAEEMMRCAAQIAGQCRLHSPQHVGCLIRLADIVLRRGKLREAIQLFTECLEQLTAAYGAKGHRSIADCLSSLSRACVRLGRMHEGEQYSRQAVEVIDALNHHDVEAAAKDCSLLPLLDRHAKILRQTGKLDDVSKAHARMLSIAVKSFAKTQRETESTIKGLRVVGDVLSGRAVHRMEADFASKALESIRTGGSGAINSETAGLMLRGGTLFSLGRVMLQEGRTTEAEPLLMQSIQLFEKVHGANHARVCYGHITHAACLMSQTKRNRRKGALAAVERAVKILESARGTMHRDLAECGGPLPLKATLHAMLGQSKQSLQVWRKVLLIRKRNLACDHEDVVFAEVEVLHLNSLVVAESGGSGGRGRNTLDECSVNADAIEAAAAAALAETCKRCGKSVTRVRWALGAASGKPNGAQHTRHPTRNAVTAADCSGECCRNCLMGEMGVLLAKARIPEGRRALSLPKWRAEIVGAKSRAQARLATWQRRNRSHATTAQVPAAPCLR